MTTRDIKTLSKLAEMNVTEKQTKMLEDYIPKMLEFCDKLSSVKIPEEILTQMPYTHDLDRLREDIKSNDYLKMPNPEIRVPRMVNKD